MSILSFFHAKPKKSAALAKERLQVVIAHERSKNRQPEFLPELKQELLEVLRKYINVDEQDIDVSIENQDSCEILELNVTLPGAGKE